MRILNFGSMNIDHVYQVESFAAPGETICAKRLDYFCGGKGLNQSVALARAGAQVYHAGKIGRDGGELAEVLLKNGVHTDYLDKTDVVNGHALIQVDSAGQNSIVIYGGSNQTVTQDDIDRVLMQFGEDDLVLTQNEISGIAHLAKRCYEKNIRLVFNPSPMSRELLLTFPFAYVSLFLINEIEGQEMTGKAEAAEILDAMRKTYPHAAVVLTLGKNGAVYRDADQCHVHGTYDVPIVDTTAAGDTFTGFFLSCMARGESIPSCLEKASVASSLAVSRQGASDSIPQMEEVLAACKTLPYVPSPLAASLCPNP